MYSVFLSFNVENPDSEDEAVRSYLDEHDLEPKMRGTDTLEGQDFEVQYFGGCYLGRHLQVIGDMQRTTVEKEMLAGEIEATLRAATDSPVRKALANLAEPELKEILAGLVREFYRDSSFGPDEEGYLKVTLVPAMTEQRFMEMSSNRVKPHPGRPCEAVGAALVHLRRHSPCSAGDERSQHKQGSQHSEDQKPVARFHLSIPKRRLAQPLESHSAGGRCKRFPCLAGC